MARFYQLPDEAFADSRLNDGVLLKCLMLVLRLSARDGYCFATNGYIADSIGVNPETVSRALAKLASFGYLKLDHTPNQGRMQRHITPMTHCAETQGTLREDASHIAPNVKPYCAETHGGLSDDAMRQDASYLAPNDNDGCAETQGGVAPKRKGGLRRNANRVIQEELNKKELKKPLSPVGEGATMAPRSSAKAKCKESAHPLSAAQVPMQRAYEQWANSHGKVYVFHRKELKPMLEAREFMAKWLAKNPQQSDSEDICQNIIYLWQRALNAFDLKSELIPQFERGRYTVTEVCNDIHRHLDRLTQPAGQQRPKYEARYDPLDPRNYLVRFGIKPDPNKQAPFAN